MARPLNSCDSETPRACIQIYGAPSFGAQGIFSLHCWIVTRRAERGAPIRRREIVGWSAGPNIRENVAKPDARWYGQDPFVIRELHGGQDVDDLVQRIDGALAAWPHQGRYRPYPGPNSNTLIAHVGRSVPELRLNLPPTAMGKDYRPLRYAVGRPPSGRGGQFSLWGLSGVIISPVEGLEVNLGGLSAGICLRPLALRLPGVGLCRLSIGRGRRGSEEGRDPEPVPSSQEASQP